MFWWVLDTLFWIFFYIFGIFERIFFQEALVGRFFKERMLNKEQSVLWLLYISINFKAGRFSSWDGKYCLGSAGIPPWTSGILLAETEWTSSRFEA